MRQKQNENGGDNRSPATILQDRIIDGCVDSLNKGRDAFIVAPTGAGKSRKFSVVAADRVEKGERVIVLAHRQKLINQGADNMKKWVKRPVTTTIGLDGQVDQTGDVVYCTVQTAHEKKNDLESYGVAIIDEAHHATTSNKQFQETMAALIAKNPNIMFVPATATPPEGYKGLHPRLRDADKHIMTFEEAIAVNLVRLPETKQPKMVYEDNLSIKDVVDAHRINSKSGDLEGGIRKDLTRMQGNDWNHQLVNQYRRFMEGRRVLGYFDTIKDLKGFVAEAEREGLKLGAIHSGQPSHENERLRQDFDNGRINGLMSVDMIAEGYDIDCDAVFLAKKVTSSTQYRQIIGREARAHGREDGITPLLVDLGASTLIHGNIITQAEMQTIRSALERNTADPADLLPDAQTSGNKPWVELKVPGTNRSVWGTSVDGAIIYAAPTQTGYAAFQSSIKGKVPHVDLLAIEGQSKGRPSREAMGEWFATALQRNEKYLCRLMGTAKSGVTELAKMINTDWQRNAQSIERNIGTLTGVHPALRQQQQKAMA